MSTTLEQPRTGTRGMSDGYRTLWRWHFYAGLFVMPFLLVLAITGTIYCFKPQLEPLLYPHRLVVRPQATPRLDADALLKDARHAMPADSVPISVEVLADADRSAEYVFRVPGGEQRSVYLNPYDGAVLGTLGVDSRFMQVDRMLHRKLLLGKPGELVMELAACWTLVMIGTGVALWWPRRQNSGRAEFWPRFSLRGRPLWKSIHAVMGIWLAVGAVAFVLSGLPWTGSWGRHFKSLATSANLGSPPGSWGDLAVQSIVPGQHGGAQPHESSAQTGRMQHHGGGDSMPGMVMDDLPVPIEPWAVGNVPVPDSASAQATASPIPLQQVISQAASMGVNSDYTLALPASRDGVYTISYFPPDPKLERTIYIDQYSGAVIRDIRYADYGALAQAVSYGTSLHMGRYFGLPNQIISAVISLGLGAMALTGAVMWWKRRPASSLGAPSRENAAPPMRAWAAGLVGLGVIFPLMGMTIVAVWLLDRMVFERRYLARC
ncbi:PepSY-associated TM helix domain-containing protein [Burkholderia multivorans]|uniref:Peptidase n=1 Tax=Burkholderia multivorans TaxID=87883 RepID=A0AB37ASB6_9BURK|nr:PepSY domain-containing protein [Burkholderia multivorans]PRE45405.1 peptidase [Burkholderia multivorans]PRE52213.1 peptidase [Burkholderia multivorans]